MIIKEIPYIEDNLLFLEQVLDFLKRDGIATSNILFRASEQEGFQRITTFGTDRGGFPGSREWKKSPTEGPSILHEDVIYATTEEDIRKGEQIKEMSTSLKKFEIIDNPLLLIYDKSCFTQVDKTEYVFNNPSDKPAALLAMFNVIKHPEIQGWFCPEDGLFYRELAKDIHSGHVIEVGSWKGRSTSYIGKLCNENNTKLTCIDSLNGSADNFNEAYLKMIQENDVERIFKENMRNCEIDIDFMCQDSSIASQTVVDKSIDLIFIDSSHDYNSVTMEIMQWFPKLKKGGILAGHDYTEKHSGVIRAVNEFCTKNEIILKTGGYSIWYFEKQDK